MDPFIISKYSLKNLFYLAVFLMTTCYFRCYPVFTQSFLFFIFLSTLTTYIYRSIQKIYIMLSVSNVITIDSLYSIHFTTYFTYFISVFHFIVVCIPSGIHIYSNSSFSYSVFVDKLFLFLHYTYFF